MRNIGRFLAGIVGIVALPALALASTPPTYAAKGWSMATNRGPLGAPTTSGTQAVVPGSGGASPTYGTIAKLQAQEAVMAERIKVAEEQRKLAELQASIHAVDSGGPGGGGLLMKPGSEPMVLRIEGVPGALTALIEMPSGGLLRVTRGESFSSIGNIVAITNFGVTVKRGDKTRVIEFASSAANQPGGASGPGARAYLPGSMSAPPVPVSGNMPMPSRSDPFGPLARPPQ